MFGDRLKLARTMAGHSLRDLAKAIGDETSARSLAKIERGEALPNSQVAILMAQVLNVPFGYLFSDEVAGIEDLEFRKRSRTKIADRARVELEVINHMQRCIAAVEILGIAGRSEKEQPPSNRQDREEEGEILAQELRRKWKLGIEPIRDITSLLERRGVKVLVIGLPKGISGLTCLVQPLRSRSPSRPWRTSGGCLSPIHWRPRGRRARARCREDSSGFATPHLPRGSSISARPASCCRSLMLK